MQTVGISLAYLSTFIEENGGRVKMAEMTTADVKQYVVKIQTASAQETYVQRMSRQSIVSPDKAKSIGEASWFVIHSWKSKFLELADSLNDMFDQEGLTDSQKENTFLWIDLFCFNQHNRGGEKDLAWFNVDLGDHIRKIGQAVVVAHPWDTVFTRSWCCFEIYCSALSNCRLELAMPSDEHARLLQSLAADPEIYLQMSESQVKTKYATATKIEDKNTIFSAMEKNILPGGSATDIYTAWDTVICEVLQNWVVRTLQRKIVIVQQQQQQQGQGFQADSVDESSDDSATAVRTEATKRGSRVSFEWLGTLPGVSDSQQESNPVSVEATGWMRTLASVFEGLGRFESSLPLRQQVANAMFALFGDTADQFLDVCRELAETYKLMHRFEKTRPILEIVLTAMRAKKGRDDLGTIQASYELAILCVCQGVFDQAEELLHECFSLRKRLIGEDHHDTLVTMHSLAELLAITDRPHDAIAMYNDVITKRKRICGEDSKETIDSIKGLAQLYNNLGKFDQSLVLLRRVLGENNIDTLRCMFKLSVTLSSQGKFSESQVLLEEVVPKFSKLLGKLCPETIEAIYVLAGVYDDLQQFDRALPLYQDCLSAYQSLELNQEGGRVDQCFEAIAQLHVNMGNPSAAIKAFHECLDRAVALSAETGATSIRSAKATSIKNRLTILYIDQGDLTSAIALAIDCLAERSERLGSDHTDTLSSLSLLASLRHSQDDLHEALRLYEECLLRRVSVLGKDHVHTKHVKRKVMELRKELGPEVDEEEVGSWMMH